MVETAKPTLLLECRSIREKINDRGFGIGVTEIDERTREVSFYENYIFRQIADDILLYLIQFEKDSYT